MASTLRAVFIAMALACAVLSVGAQDNRAAQTSHSVPRTDRKAAAGISTAVNAASSVTPVSSLTPQASKTASSNPDDDQIHWLRRDSVAIFSAIISVVSVIFVIINVRASRTTLRAKIGWDVFSLLDGQDGKIRRHRHTLNDLVNQAQETLEPFDAIKIIAAGPDLEQGLHEMLRAYDKAGHLVKFRAIPIDFLFDFYSRPIAEAWKYLAPYVLYLREKRGHSNHLKQFEILATGAALFRQTAEQMKLHPDEKPIFSTDPEMEASWARWRKRAWKRM